MQLCDSVQVCANSLYASHSLHVCIFLYLLSSPLQIKEPKCSSASVEERRMIDDSVARLAACTHTGDRTSRRKRKRREEEKGGLEGRKRREEEGRRRREEEKGGREGRKEKVHSYSSLKCK